MGKSFEIKIYNGYGHTHNLLVYGHVFKWKSATDYTVHRHKWKQAIQLFKLFIVKPYPFARVRLLFRNQQLEVSADQTGFFQFQWTAEEHLEAGLHDLMIGLVNDEGELVGLTEGKIYVPHITQYVYVSDIDDTVLISHSATIFRRLRELLIKGPHKRRIFEDSVSWYQQLSVSDTDLDHPNPFFYVSSSEWNLYDYLQEIFLVNKLPAGSLLLSDLKRWYDFFKTGKTRHGDKKTRIERLLQVFPNQQFVLIGDNSQRDPVIYGALADQFPDRIKAIYIRNVKPKQREVVLKLFQDLENKAVITCLFSNSLQAIDHAVSIGLIPKQ